MTAAAFLAAARRLAASLPADAPGPGSGPESGTSGPPVVNLCTDRFRFALGFAACLLRGRVSLLLGDRSPARLAALEARYPGLHALTDAPMPDLALPATLVPAEAATQAASGFAGPPPTLPAGRLAAIVFTSGSTGEPVGHRKSWGALAARSLDAGRRFRMRPERPAAIVATVPPFHMYGFETSVLLPLHAAAASWCGPAFYPVDVQAALAACPDPRVLVTTPLQLRALLAAPGALPPLARVISATAPLPPEMAAEVEQRWETEMWEIFGATEVGSIATRRTVAGEVWRSYPRVRLRLAQAVGGAASAEDDAASPGVEVHAPHAPPWALSDRIDLLDPMRFRLLGRRTDLVKLGGRRVSLAGLTRILTGIEGVEDGIFIAPEELETQPTARLLAFAVAPGLAPEEILAALRARIEPLFLPRRVVRVDRLPRDSLGKLPADALAALRAQVDDG